MWVVYDCREIFWNRMVFLIMVGEELGKIGGKMGGGERYLLSIAFLPNFPFIICIFVRLCRSFPSSTRLFIHAMWVIPGYDFMDGDFNINVNSTANVLQSCFSSLYIRISCDSTCWNVRSYFRDNVRLYLHAG